MLPRNLPNRLPDGGPMDLIEVFTRPLPVWAISRVLGLPDHRRDDVRRWTDAATATIGAQLPADRWPQVEQDLLDFQRTIAAELERRRDHPSADLLAALVQATAAELGPDEEAIGVGELVSLTRELMVAGNESSLRLLADIVWQLDARPEEWERVRADPQRADRIVEEAVRLASPSAAVFRRVVHDTTLGGYPLPAGATLVVSVLSANRDETVFPRLRPLRSRSPNHATACGLRARYSRLHRQCPCAHGSPPRRAGPRSAHRTHRRRPGPTAALPTEPYRARARRTARAGGAAPRSRRVTAGESDQCPPRWMPTIADVV